MYLNIQHDNEASKLSEKLTFYTDKFVLNHSDIESLKDNKLLKFVSTEFLPENIDCQVVAQFETYNIVKVIFFNTTLKLSEEIYEEPLENKDLIEWYRQKWYFYLEFNTSLNDSWLILNLSYEK